MQRTITFEQVTRWMQSLETTIAREQAHIAKCGAANDADPDQNWLDYKANAEMHLKTWDEWKTMRDSLKPQA